MGQAYTRAGVLSDVRARNPRGSERQASSRSQEQGWKENRPPAPYLPRPDPFDLYRCATRQEVFHDRNHRGRPCGADIRHLGEKQAPGLFGFCKGITAVIPSRPLTVTVESSGWKRMLPWRERTLISAVEAILAPAGSGHSRRVALHHLQRMTASVVARPATTSGINRSL